METYHLKSGYTFEMVSWVPWDTQSSYLYDIVFISSGKSLPSPLTSCLSFCGRPSFWVRLVCPHDPTQAMLLIGRPRNEPAPFLVTGRHEVHLSHHWGWTRWPGQGGVCQVSPQGHHLPLRVCAKSCSLSNFHSLPFSICWQLLPVAATSMTDAK